MFTTVNKLKLNYLYPKVKESPAIPQWLPIKDSKKLAKELEITVQDCDLPLPKI